MKNFLILIAILPLAAHAEGKSPPAPEPESIAISSSLADADAKAAAQAAAQAAAAAQAGAVNTTDVKQSAASEASQSQQASADNAGNHQTTVFRQVRQAPAVLAAQTNTTMHCAKARTFGLSLPGGGITLGGTKVDRDCVLNRAADEELARGNTGAAVRLRCEISFYREILGEDCIALANVPTPPSPPLPPVWVEDECDARVEKAFQQCNKK